MLVPKNSESHTGRMVSSHPSRLWSLSLGGIVLILSFVSGSLQAATTLLLDFNTTEGVGAVGGTWNAYATPANINGSALLNSGGTTTGVTLSVSGTISDNANTGTAVFDNNAVGLVGLPAWVTSATDNGASGDNFFTSNTGAVQHSFTLTFGGLTAGDSFSLDMLASRNSGSGRGFFEYSLDGGNTWAGFKVMNPDGTAATAAGWSGNDTQSQVFSLQSDGFTAHRYLNVSNVTLTGTTLAVRVMDGDAVATTFNALNAARLTITAVPEPGRCLILLPGLLAAFLRRRR